MLVDPFTLNTTVLFMLTTIIIVILIFIVIGSFIDDDKKPTTPPKKNNLTPTPKPNFSHNTNNNAMSNLSAEQLLDKGIQEKKNGDFRASIRTYLQLMIKAPDLPATYYSLAKVEYLVNHPDTKTHYLVAIQKTITMTALLMENDGQDSRFYRINLMLGDSSRKEMLDNFADPLRHLGHAILDPKPQNELIDFVYKNNPINLTKEQSQELAQSYIEAYRFRLAGGGLEHNDFMEKYKLFQFDVEQFMDEFYRQTGETFALEKIDWAKLDQEIHEAVISLLLSK